MFSFRLIFKKALYSLFCFYYKLKKPVDFIVTGIPRSGTSLISTILCKPINCYCFNEIQYKIEILPIFFNRMRKKIRIYINSNLFS